MPKIYTKKGDQGVTSLLGGQRVLKSCLEMEAIGEIDELNALFGMLIEEVDEEKFKRNGKEIKKKLEGIQKNLFVIGSNLAALQSPGIKTYTLTHLQTYKLEKWIDSMEKDLPKLNNFILPGGSEESALCFYIRAVCRRAERRVVDLSPRYEVKLEIKKYLNRLSDLLFVLGRWFNLKSKVKEVKWQGMMKLKK